MNYYKRIYPMYVDILVHTDDDIKQVILYDKPLDENQDLQMDLGFTNFHYTFKSDINNFDKFLLANSLIDVIQFH